MRDVINHRRHQPPLMAFCDRRHRLFFHGLSLVTMNTSFFSWSPRFLGTADTVMCLYGLKSIAVKISTGSSYFFMAFHTYAGYDQSMWTKIVFIALSFWHCRYYCTAVSTAICSFYSGILISVEVVLIRLLIPRDRLDATNPGEGSPISPTDL